MKFVDSTFSEAHQRICNFEASLVCYQVGPLQSAIPRHNQQPESWWHHVVQMQTKHLCSRFCFNTCCVGTGGLVQGQSHWIRYPSGLRLLVGDVGSTQGEAACTSMIHNRHQTFISSTWLPAGDAGPIGNNNSIQTIYSLEEF